MGVMNTGDILLVIFDIVCLLFLVVITVASAALIICYQKSKNIELSFSRLFEHQEKVLPEFNISFRELLMIVSLLIIGVVLYLHVDDMLRIPMIMLLLGLCQILVILFITRKIKLFESRRMDHGTQD